MTSWAAPVSRNRRIAPYISQPVVPTIVPVSAASMTSFSELQQHIEIAFENAEKGISKITDGLLKMEGMSGKKTRHFYNNLLNINDARYLEIGTWKGSSVCSAMYGNKAMVVCIDNWSEFGGPKHEFLTNFNRYKGVNDARFIEQDCYKVDISRLPTFNIYMYDDSHPPWGSDKQQEWHNGIYVAILKK